MKMSYGIEYGPTWWECTVEIDHNDETLANIKSMVEFWMGWEDRLETNDGDYTKTFLQQLAREICMIEVEFNYNLVGVTGEFNNREGWCKMDGSMGIKIVNVDDFEFEHRQYEVGEGVPV